MESSSSILPKHDLQEHILALSLTEMEEMAEWLKGTIAERRKHQSLQQPPIPRGRQVVDTLQTGKVVYRLEGIRCGKKKCKCNDGKLHGPYWYAYSWNGKKLKSTYIGKQLDPTLLQAESLNLPEDHK